jgi:hypothetical protein
MVPPVKRRLRLASWLRKYADRLDYDGAPKRTSWSFTHEDGWGTVFNQDGYGCPLWYMGDDYELAHEVSHPELGGPCDVKWVTIGTQTTEGVHVLGSAEVTSAVTTRRINGYDEASVPGARRKARVPRWRIALRCEMDSFVTLPGDTYQEAVIAMFGKPGIRG